MVNALVNALASPEQLSTSPSQQDGLTPEEETSLKFAGVRLLQLAGELLEMYAISIPSPHLLRDDHQFGPQQEEQRLIT